MDKSWDANYEGKLHNKYRTRGRFLGKLSYKEESAGKVRVFAMVDPWTQWVLQPLHKILFKILRRHPMDGTFDQLKPLKRIPWGQTPIYSFDLSAATDRLPISIQKGILSELFGKPFGDHWSNLLVGRGYQVSKPRVGSKFLFGSHPKEVWYSVGQPMGALSSWAMLAVTHHYIVQYCAWIRGVTPVGTLFKQYAVLGDDIIIWNKPVADQYLKVMKLLGVEIGLAKSIISPKGIGIEFAKKTLIMGQDVSPIPYKEQSSAHTSMASLIMFQRKYNMSDLSVLRFLGYGYKVDPSKNNRIVKSLSVAKAIPTSYDSLKSLFTEDRPFISVGFTPRSVIRKTLVTLVHSELQSIEKRSTQAYWTLLQRSTSQ